MKGRTRNRIAIAGVVTLAVALALATGTFSAWDIVRSYQNISWS
ncbi:hypothetical protein [Salirhabdus salicampi]|nr:hypothetical protein [Salirhabdus salicampi]